MNKKYLADALWLKFSISDFRNVSFWREIY